MRPGGGARRYGVPCWAFAAVLALAALAALAWQRLRPDRFQPTLTVRLADGDRITLGFDDWAPFPRMGGPGSGHYGRRFHWLLWRQGHQTQACLFAWNERQPPAIELCSDGGNHHWLACGNEVTASLDRATGRMVNRGGWVADPSLSRDRQRNDYAVFVARDPVGTAPSTPQPGWASPTGGVVLGRSRDTGGGPMRAEEGGFAFGYGG